MLDRLYSPEEVAATFPDGHRPSVRRLIRVARQVNCCCKLGRGIGFTADQVKQLQAYLSCSGSSVTRKDRLTGTSVAPLRGSTYLKVREQLNELKRKPTGIRGKRKFIQCYVSPQVYGGNGLHNITKTAHLSNISCTLAPVCSDPCQVSAENPCRNRASAFLSTTQGG